MEPPSFSLGLDFDLDTEIPLVAPDSPSRESSAVVGNDQDNYTLHESPPGPSAPTQTAPIFRRLRRGPSDKKASLSPNGYSEQPPHNIDDDIEEFSSQELPSKDENGTAPPRSICSSSKLSLHGHMNRTTQPAASTSKQLPVASTSSVAKDNKRPTHSKSSMSPLRHFQLLESDSDDSFELMDANNDARRNQSTSETAPKHRKRMAFVSPLTDLWDAFRPKETTPSVPTPALDSFCEEYFKRVKDKKTTSSSAPRGSCVSRSEGCNDTMINGSRNCQVIDLENGVPPCHRYFFHSDIWIQKLVRSRLSHFHPLGTVNNTGNQQLDALVIDYMSQFGEGCSGTKQRVGGKTNSAVKKSSRGRKNEKSSSVGATSTSGDWVNPRNLVGALPKDAGKRRVHAESQSPGQWYTAENGRKVYVNKNGQELTGQSAYRQYRRESGGGFRKSKGKTSSKRRKK